MPRPLSRRRCGRSADLDVVVANAGVGLGGTAGDVSDDAWRATIDINLSGALFLVRAAMPHLEARGGGSIVLVSSVSGFVSSASSAAYVASKAAMIGLAKSIAVDFGPAGVRANALCPGLGPHTHGRRVDG